MIDWVMKTQGVSFRHAVELLRYDAPLAADIVNQATVRKLSIPIAPDADEVALLVQMIGCYHGTLEQGRTWIRSCSCTSAWNKTRPSQTQPSP